MGVYVGAESALVAKWIVSRAATQTTALNAISVGLSSRVYEDLAPEGVGYPFIVFNCQTDPTVVRGVGVMEVMVSNLWTVKAVAQVLSDDTLAPVANVIHTFMTSEFGEVIGTDGMVFTSRRMNAVRYVTNEQGHQFRHLGSTFEIQAQAA